MNSVRKNLRSGALKRATSSGRQSGSINKGLIATFLLFLLVFVITLWFEINDRSDRIPASVQFKLDSDPGLTITPEQSAPAPGIPAAAHSRQDNDDEQTKTEETQPDPAISAQTVEEIRDPDLAKPETTLATPESLEKNETAGPVGDLAISGRVLERSGTPVEGITVVARAYHLFDRDSGRTLPARNHQHETRSGYNGAYAFERLLDGEYHLSTVATDVYPRVQILVRAGVDFADLILTGQLELRVHGVVTTADDKPLAGVRVSPVVQDAPAVTTGKDGSYEFRVTLRDIVSTLTVRASKTGFDSRELRLEIARHDADAIELDIVMQTDEEAGLATVRGFVRGSGNEAVPNLGIRLSSVKERKSYQAVTEEQGRFEMRGVHPGDDYMLSINAPSIYKDYFRRNIRIPQSGVTLDIELEAQDAGTLRGQMVNLYGTPVSNFSMVLKMKETSFYSQRVFGDGSGYFEVETAPAGELLLRTESTPYHTVDGIKLSSGGSLSIPVVLDWGYDEIRGRVMDASRQPVAVPGISLTWSHEQNGLRSTSRRTTAADKEGNFHFTQLGPGVHRLSITVAGYKPVTVNHDVALQGSLLEVELSPED